MTLLNQYTPAEPCNDPSKGFVLLGSVFGPLLYPSGVSIHETPIQIYQEGN